MINIAIDGPAGAGKSTVARAVAKKLGILYLDTGAMYRAMTWAMLDAGVDVDDPQAVAGAAASVSIISGTDPLGPTIHVGSVDVAGPIRGDEVTGAVSAVSAVPAVRERLVAIQRDEVATALREGAGIVVEGRDITTVVAPDADVRVLLIADPEARVARRAAEVEGKATAEEVTDQVLRRDRDDSTVSNFTVAAEGVVVIDSTFLSPDQVVDRIVELAR